MIIIVLSLKCLVPPTCTGLKGQRKKAQDKRDLAEEARICNTIGELYTEDGTVMHYCIDPNTCSVCLSASQCIHVVSLSSSDASLVPRLLFLIELMEKKRGPANEARVVHTVSALLSVLCLLTLSSRRPYSFPGISSG